MPSGARHTSAHLIQQSLARVHDQQSFIQSLLIDSFGWQVPESAERIEEISFGWSKEELRAADLDKRLIDGFVWQIQSLAANQPWGIFLLEFQNADAFVTGRGLTGPLRKVLRGLVPNRRKSSDTKSWAREHLLFICTHEYRHFRFAYFKSPPEQKVAAPLATFGWNADDTARRTVCEHNLPALVWPDDSRDTDEWVRKWAAAFDVEKVTKRFYERYEATFQEVEGLIKQSSGLKDAAKLRLFTQTLFNRLMFLRFIERKGWLAFDGRADYLAALVAAGGIKGQSVYHSRLRPLFFEGLAIEGRQKSAAIGEVPFLNGGLFEESELDRLAKDVPDTALLPMIGPSGLFYVFNFTVEESTPLDIEVAVDPEMLGKVFEELVTGRHDSGSYYTPRSVVSFMCREAIKGYLGHHCNAPLDAIVALVELQDVSKLTDTQARDILTALDDIKAVDPACGSGAYLLGLLHELVGLYRLLFSDKLVKDARSLYELKLRIISRNLYGVDLDLFATNIAMLRLWLSLAVDAHSPVPLPNLDFKIETGNSLLAPNPQEVPDLFRKRLQDSADVLVALKEKYFLAHGDDKDRLRDTIVGEEQRLRRELASEYNGEVVDWRIQFAEAFANNRGGFDIVLANPPYVRHELIASFKPQLKKLFPASYVGTADLYCYFYFRALELLRSHGMLAFISSNKWLRAAYGAKLRALLAKRTRLLSLIDFGDAPIFNAVAYPCIVVLRLAQPDTTDCEVLALTWQQGDAVSQFVDTFRRNCFPLLQRDLTEDGWRIENSVGLRLGERIKSAGRSLRAFVGERVYRGITTGFNEAFVVDNDTRERLVAEDASSDELLKRFSRGRDIDRWRLETSKQWLVFTCRGIEIERYPAILRHLTEFRERLEPGVDGGRKPGSYKWYEIQDNIAYWQELEKPKLVSTKVSIRPTFAFDESNSYLGNTAYFIPVETDGLFLLGLLNSNVFAAYAKRVFVEKQNGWYEVQPKGLEDFSIPDASDEQRGQCEALVAIIVRLKQHFATHSDTMRSRDGLLVGYLEQLLNALVYELYFPEELHLAELSFFGVLAGTPLTQVLSDVTKGTGMEVVALRDIFEAIYDVNHPVRIALEQLQTLDIVRIVEEQV